MQSHHQNTVKPRHSGLNETVPGIRYGEVSVMADKYLLYVFPLKSDFEPIFRNSFPILLRFRGLFKSWKNKGDQNFVRDGENSAMALSAMARFNCTMPCLSLRQVGGSSPFLDNDCAIGCPASSAITLGYM